jgi:hypothetical protein
MPEPAPNPQGMCRTYQGAEDGAPEGRSLEALVPRVANRQALGLLLNPTEPLVSVPPDTRTQADSGSVEGTGEGSLDLPTGN